MISPTTLVTVARQLVATAGASEMPNQPCHDTSTRATSVSPVPAGGSAASPAWSGYTQCWGKEPPREAELQLLSPLSPLSPPLQPSHPHPREAAIRGQVIDELSRHQGLHLSALPWRGASWSIFTAAVPHAPAAVTSRDTQSQWPLDADKLLLLM